MSDHENAAILYRREGDWLRFATQNQTNHEMREVMVGMWARLSKADRDDHIRELQHYNTEPEMHLSPVASVIATADTSGMAIHLVGVPLFRRGDFKDEE
jgi:hypothetical protein